MKQSIESVLEKLEERGFVDPTTAPNEIIDEICAEACFDLDAVATRLRIRNRGMQVLNAHLVIDHVLTFFLSAQFVAKSKMKIDRMSFDQKVELLYSLGRLSDDSRYWAKRLNGIRNKLAHELDFTVSVADSDEFISHFESLDEKGLLRRFKFAHALLLLVLKIESDRIGTLKLEVKREIALQRIRDLLDRARGG